LLETLRWSFHPASTARYVGSQLPEYRIVLILIRVVLQIIFLTLFIPQSEVPGFYLLEDYQQLLRGVDKEDTSPYNLEIEGVIPQGLIGNYFVTGPGVLRQGTKIALIDFFRILYTFCHIQVFWHPECQMATTFIRLMVMGWCVASLLMPFRCACLLCCVVCVVYGKHAHTLNYVRLNTSYTHSHTRTHTHTHTRTHIRICMIYRDETDVLNTRAASCEHPPFSMSDKCHWATRSQNQLRRSEEQTSKTTWITSMSDLPFWATCPSYIAESAPTLRFGAISCKQYSLFAYGISIWCVVYLQRIRHILTDAQGWSYSLKCIFRMSSHSS